MLWDTHCHIHGSDFKADPDQVIAAGRQAGVERLLCVGTDMDDSRLAVEFARLRSGCWASVGVHPHEASRYVDVANFEDSFYKLAQNPAVRAIGECGLDYFYEHSKPADQKSILHAQLSVARKLDLPLVFHVRDAFEDFWPIVDQYKGLKGTIHSFTASDAVLGQALERGFYVSLNGIITFTKHQWQLDMARKVPLDRLLLETDAPFLTPAPFRGTMNEPKYVMQITEFLSQLRDQTVQEIADATTANANLLFLKGAQ